MATGAANGQSHRIVNRWVAVVASIAVHGVIAIALAAVHLPAAPPTPEPMTIEVELRREMSAEIKPEPRPREKSNDRAPPPASASAPRPRRTSGSAPGTAEADSSPAAPGLLTFSGRAIGTDPRPDAPPDDGVRLPTLGDLAREVVANDAPPDGPPDLVGRRGTGPFDATRAHNLRPDGDGGYKLNRETFTARVDRDGTVHFNDKPNVQLDNVGVQGGGLFGIGGKFDVTDAVMRANGEDPYRYEKAKFLEETRELRMALAEADRRDRLRDAIHDLPKLLDRIWAHTTWPAVERRRALFDLWDECAEAADDDATLKAAQAVRATIVAFIRKKLPRGSADAYDDAELARLNAARQSRQTFEPYPDEIE